MNLRLFTLVSVAVGTALPLIANTPRLAAQTYVNMNCYELWHARNSIYAARGYCFKSRRAINIFGSRCHPPFGKLNSVEQNRVAAIRKLERGRNCDASGEASDYGSMTCDRLWYTRNLIYAEKGHCFDTKRGRAVFGVHCFPPYGVLDSAEQEQVSAIRKIERAKNCR